MHSSSYCIYKSTHDDDDDDDDVTAWWNAVSDWLLVCYNER